MNVDVSRRWGLSSRRHSGIVTMARWWAIGRSSRQWAKWNDR